MQICLIAALLTVGLGQDKSAQPPIVRAVLNRNVSLTAQLLDAKANPNAREILTSKPNATEGNPGGVKSAGRTVLDIAVDRQSLPLVKLLLDHKANPNARSPYNWTPLMTACQRSNVDIVRLLLRMGAKPNLRNIHGDTAIIFAANLDRFNIVEALVDAGANLNGGFGQSALDIAAQSGAKATVKFLLQAGADPNFTRPGYLTPLEYSYQSDDSEITNLIRRAGGKGRTKAELDKLQAADDTLRSKQSSSADTEKTGNTNSGAMVTAEDLKVIECAIVDMATYSGKEFELSYFSKATKMILLDSTAGVVNEFTENQMNAELDERKANDIDLTMRKDLIRRNTGPTSLAKSDITNPRIKLKPKKSVARGFGAFDFEKSDARGYASVYLPGYSSDGSRAVLRFWFGPTPHGAAGTYLLEKKNGRWRVVWRDFAHYA
ncbi:MAG: ankyrin repeat domain-containing protein [Fimbriimonadaceae bacterium]|nr:ankyrin repeat domain-containing protein [Fimbriimonadaceae bacterium]